VPVRDIEVLFTERAVVQVVGDSVITSRGYSADLIDVFEKDPLVEAAALAPLAGRLRHDILPARGRGELIELLRRHGADPWHPNNTRQTPVGTAPPDRELAVLIVSGVVALTMITGASYVVITVGRGDGEVADRFFSMYRAAARMHSHSLDQFATFFEGLEIVPPGLLLAEQWQPDLRHVRPVPKRPGEVLVGVGKVPGRPPHESRGLNCAVCNAVFWSPGLCLSVTARSIRSSRSVMSAISGDVPPWAARSRIDRT
jgi:S-adenosyl methyltransferase